MKQTDHQKHVQDSQDQFEDAGTKATGTHFWKLRFVGESDENLSYLVSFFRLRLTCQTTCNERVFQRLSC